MSESESKKVTVAVRIRPKLPKNGEKYEMSTIKKVDASTCVSVNPTRLREQIPYSFDYVFDEDDDQEEVYRVAAADIANSTLEGVDNAILTYGQTGSGKTYTLLGSKLLPDGTPDSESGIFLRTLIDLLQYKERCKSTHHLVIVLSIVEVYNDQLRDLLNNKAPLQVIEQGDSALYSPATKIIQNQHDVNKAFLVALTNRTVAPTLMNDSSSRSHAIFTVDLLQQRKTSESPTPPIPEEHLYNGIKADEKSPSTPFSTTRYSNSMRVKRVSYSAQDEPPLMRGRPSSSHSFSTSITTTETSMSSSTTYPVTKSKLMMVDLAGSERAKKSGAHGVVLQEAVAVNKSLTSLGKVVNSMHAGLRHIPFRESRLTKILKPSLVNSQSKLLLITNLAPTESSYSETASSLHFSNRLLDLRPPSNLTYRADSEKEVGYLKKLRACEELGSELRIVNATFPGYRDYKKITNFRNSSWKAYKLAHTKREEEEKRKSAESLQKMVTELVRNLESETPELAHNNDRRTDLTLQFEIQCNAENERAARLEQKIKTLELQLLDYDQSSPYSGVSNQYQKACVDLRKSFKEHSDYSSEIARLQDELKGLSSPAEENIRDADEEEQHILGEQTAAKMVEMRKQCGEALSRLLLEQKETNKLEEELKNLKQEESSATSESSQNTSDFTVDCVEGVSPLATHFEGLRTPVVYSDVCDGVQLLTNDRKSRLLAKEKIVVILDRIQRAKLCCDEDGRQIFSLLTRVKVRTSDINDILATPGCPWSDADGLQTACEQEESINFAVRAHSLFPSVTLLKRAHSGDIGVLEFVEILLKTWQLDSNSNKENSPTHARKVHQLEQQPRSPVFSSVP